jgi:uncharacterized protein
MKIPFIHKFQDYYGNYYIYDVNTNRILRVSKIVYNIINDYLILSHDDLISRWRTQHKQNEIKKALEQLDIQNKKGVFLPCRPIRMKGPICCNKHLEDKLAKKLSQLVLNITEQCNLRCRYCQFSGSYVYERPHSFLNMNKDILMKALYYFAQHSIYSEDIGISFYGGEPLINFEKIVWTKNTWSKIAINTVKPSWVITTNGTLLNKDIIAYLIKENFQMQVSLDGPSNIHDKYRLDVYGKPTFDKIQRNLINIAHTNDLYYKTFVSFQCTIAPDYDLLEIEDFFEKNSLVSGNILRCSYVSAEDTAFYNAFDSNVFSKHNKQFATIRDNYISCRINNKEPTKFGKSLFDKAMIRIHKRQITKKINHINANGICLPGIRKFFVDAKGDIFPCERVGQAYNLGHITTGINKCRIKEIVSDYITVSINKCLNCWASRLCTMCFGYARTGSQLDPVKKDKNCSDMLSIITNNLTVYSTILEKNPHALDFVKNVTTS